MRNSAPIDKDLTRLADNFDLSAFLEATGLTIQELEADSKYYAQEQTKVELPKTNNPHYFLRSKLASTQEFEQNVSALNRTR